MQRSLRDQFDHLASSSDAVGRSRGSRSFQTSVRGRRRGGADAGRGPARDDRRAWPSRASPFARERRCTSSERWQPSPPLHARGTRRGRRRLALGRVAVAAAQAGLDAAPECIEMLERLASAPSLSGSSSCRTGRPRPGRASRCARRLSSRSTAVVGFKPATPRPSPGSPLTGLASAWRAAPSPAKEPEESAHAELWLPPPVKPPQISSRVAASPAANRPGTVVAQ